MSVSYTHLDVYKRQELPYPYSAFPEGPENTTASAASLFDGKHFRVEFSMFQYRRQHER